MAPMMRGLTAAVAIGSAQALKIAFIGDTGAQTSGSNGYFAAAVYDMMARENVDLVAQNGDLDYNGNPSQWDSFLERYAYSQGMDVLLSSGNHEEQVWFGADWYGSNGYKARMEARQRTSTLLSDCSGSYGERYNCMIGPPGSKVQIVSIGWKQQDSGEVARSARFVEDSFRNSDAAFRVVMMHKPEGQFNPGSAHDGYYALFPIYEAARKYGAFLTSGHDHVYGRTKLMSSYSTRPSISSRDSNNPQLVCGGESAGTSVAFVIGCGGYKFDREGDYARENYWRYKFTRSNSDRTSGALLCDFQGSKAACAFTKYDGTKLDTFEMTSDKCNSDGGDGGDGGDDDDDDDEGPLCEDNVPSGLYYSNPPGTPAPCSEIGSYCQQYDFVRAACPRTCNFCDGSLMLSAGATQPVDLVRKDGEDAPVVGPGATGTSSGTVSVAAAAGMAAGAAALVAAFAVMAVVVVHRRKGAEPRAVDPEAGEVNPKFVAE